MTRDPSTPPPAQVGKTLQTKLWAPSWKGVIITLLIAANIILIRINAELVYQNQSLKNEKLAWEARTELPAVQIQSLKCDSMEIKKELCVTATNPLSGCALCPNDWMLYGDNCYYYSDATRRTWNQSQEQCEMMRGHLLVIEDQEQQGFIRRILTPQAEVMFWIGLYHDADGWRWVNGQHYNTSLIQLKVNSGKCVLVNKVGYYTGTCSSNYRIICQRKAFKI